MAFALGPLLVRAISDKSAPRALVEDDALIAILLAELLAGMGHDVCATAATQAEAVIAATRYGTDLMIVDEGLGRGGAVFPPSRKYSARGRSHTCSSAEMRKRAEAQPDAVVVRKPFREAELARAIDMALTTAPPQVREIMRLGGSVTETVVAGDAAVWDVFACDG